MLTPMLAPMLTAALCAALCATPQPATDKLSKGDQTKLRELYTEALADASGKTTKRLVSLGEKLARKHGPEAVLAGLTGGPVYPGDDPKPRGKGRSKEVLEQHGTTWTGFGFEYDGDRFGYAVDVPRSYDPQEPTALLIDPGHGSGANQDQAGKAGYLGFWRGRTLGGSLEDCLIVRTEILEEIGAGGRRGGWPEAEALPVWEAFLRDVASRFHVDPDRIYVSGLSQTGYWAWYLGRAAPDRFAGIAPMSAVTWQVDRCLDNFTALPVYVLHGDADETCPVGQPRATTEAMNALGLPVEYREVEGGEHDFSTWSKLGGGLEWLFGQGPRKAYPERVAKRFGTEAEGSCYWVRATRLARENGGKAAEAPTAVLKASREGQRIELKSEGVRAVELCLPREVFDLDAPLTVVWNDETVHEGLVESDLERSLELAVERADWLHTAEAFLELKAP